MEQDKVKSYLETATTMAVLLIALIILGTFGWSFFAGGANSLPQAGLRKGEQFARLPGSDYSGASQTLIIALNTKCGYCGESVPFYNHVAAAQRAGEASPQVVAVFSNTSDEVERFIQEKQLKAKTIAGVNLGSLNVLSTPTMILVDKDGKVIDFWIGKLSTDGEQQVTKLLSITGA
jgi:hypothetical protein